VTGRITLYVQPDIFCPVDGAAVRASAWQNTPGISLAAFGCGHVFPTATCRACGNESPMRGDGKATWCQICEAWQVIG